MKIIGKIIFALLCCITPAAATFYTTQWYDEGPFSMAPQSDIDFFNATTPGYVRNPSPSLNIAQKIQMLMPKDIPQKVNIGRAGRGERNVFSFTRPHIENMLCWEVITKNLFPIVNGYREPLDFTTGGILEYLLRSSSQNCYKIAIFNLSEWLHDNSFTSWAPGALEPVKKSDKIWLYVFDDMPDENPEKAHIYENLRKYTDFLGKKIKIISGSEEECARSIVAEIAIKLFRASDEGFFGGRDKNIIRRLHKRSIHGK